MDIANCITFNGIITTDLIKLNDNKYGFVLRGPNQEEFPLILIENPDVRKPEDFLKKGDEISAVGILIKYKKDWAIKIYKIMRRPTDEEIKEMK